MSKSLTAQGRRGLRQGSGWRWKGRRSAIYLGDWYFAGQKINEVDSQFRNHAKCPYSPPAWRLRYAMPKETSGTLSSSHPKPTWSWMYEYQEQTSDEIVQVRELICYMWW